MADTATINVRAETRQAEKALGRLQSLLGAVVTVGAAKALADIADSATLLTNRLKQVSDSQAQTNLLFTKLTQVANTARTPLAQTGDLFFRIARSADQLGISQNEALLTTELVSKAISSAGISAQEAAGPLLQLGQALQSGRLQGDELRSILEGLPPVARALATSLNVPIGALKELGAQGKISGKQVVDAILASEQAINRDFGKTTVTIGQAITVLSNNFTILVNKLDTATGATTSIGRAIGYLSSFINFLGDNIDTLIILFNLLLAIPLVRGIRLIANGLFSLARGFTSVGYFVKDLGTNLYTFGKYVGIFVKNWKTQITGAAQPITSLADAVFRFFGVTTALLTKFVASFVRNFRGPIAAAIMYVTGLFDPLIAKFKQFFNIDDPTENESLAETNRLLGKQADAQAALNKKKEAAAVIDSKLVEFVKNLKDSLSERTKELALLGQKERLSASEFAYQSELTKLNEAAAAKGFLNKEVKTLNEKLAALARETVILEEIQTQYQAINEAGREILTTTAQSSDARLKIQQDYINASIALENYFVQNATVSEQQFLDTKRSLRSQFERDMMSAEMQNFQRSIDMKKAELDFDFYAFNQKEIMAKELFDLQVSQEERLRALRASALEQEMRQRGFTADDAKQIATDRVAFEKKNETEKTQFAIQQAASIFDDLGKRNKAAFQAAKAFNIANAVMNTYAGATKALATYPPPFNFIAAAAVVASGLAQVAAIRAQTYSGRALGGPIVGGQQYVVGERGPELITAPSGGANVTPNNQLGGTTNITFNIQTNDARGFDSLLAERKGMIINMVRQAQQDKGRFASV